MKDRDKPIHVLIPDGERNHLQKVLTCFAACRKVKVFVLARKKYTSMRFSRLVQRYLYLPDTADDKQWVAKVNELVMRYQIDVVMPVYEQRIRTLLLYKAEFLYPEKVLIPESVSSFDTANHKGLLAKHLEKFGLPGPKSRLVENAGQIDHQLMELRFPLLVKPPLATGGGDGILKFEDDGALQSSVSENKIGFPFVLQEFIPGHDIGCNVLCKEGRILAYTIQKGFMYTAKPFSPQIGLDTIHNEKVLETVGKLMESLNWTGVANVDMLYDTRSGQYLVLEINPRYWMTVEGSMMAGVNFPWLHCQTVMGVGYDLPEYGNFRFLNLKGLVGTIKGDFRLMFNRKLLWQRSPLKYVLSDPLPMVYHFFWRTANVVFNRPRF